MYPTWLVVRDHVPVEISKAENPETPDTGLESDVEKAVDASTVVLPEEKGKLASLEAGVGKDTV